LSSIQEDLRQVAMEIRRTPIRLDTWIPMIQRAADALDKKDAEIATLKQCLFQAQEAAKAASGLETEALPSYKEVAGILAGYERAPLYQEECPNCHKQSRHLCQECGEYV